MFRGRHTQTAITNYVVAEYSIAQPIPVLIPAPHPFENRRTLTHACTHTCMRTCTHTHTPFTFLSEDVSLTTSSSPLRVKTCEPV